MFPLRLAIALAAVIIAVATAPARIGETLDECQTRYGAMIGTDMSRSDYPAYVFRKDGVEIRVRLYDGKSAQEIFFGIQEALSFEQMRQIESVNLGGRDVKGHSESLYADSERDANKLAALGIRVSQIDPKLRSRLSGRTQDGLDSDPKIARKVLGSDQAPHPLSVNGEDGKGEVLVITTAEFGRVFNRVSGF